MKKDKAYWILALVLLIPALGILLLPERNEAKEIPPEALLEDIIKGSRYIDCDELTRRIIEEDPSLLMIDLRIPGEYRQFSLPGSINIPADSILNPKWEDVLWGEGMDKVFISNSGALADEAWVLCKRKMIPDLYVMKGGLNLWAKQILQPEAPPETASLEEKERYQFRLGAVQYFTGGKTESVSQEAVQLPLIKREKKTKVQGGC